MYLIYALFIFVTLPITTIQNSAQDSTVDFIFKSVSKQVEQSVVNLFLTLKVSDCFVKSKDTRKETDLYKYLKEMIDNYHRTYTQIASMEYFEDYSKSVLTNNVLDNIFNGTINCTDAETIVDREFAYFTPLLITNSDSKDPYELSLNFIRNFMNKVNDLSVDDFMDQRNLGYAQRSYFNIIRKNMNNEIEIWEPGEKHKEDEIASRRLYKGINTTVYDYPFMVSVHENREFLCSGSIIRSELIITAASCLQRVYESKKKPHYISVRVGSNYVHWGGFTVVVTQAIFHPYYNATSLLNNLVLLNVAKGAFTKYKWIKRIKYQVVETKFDSVKILGWGLQKTDLRRASLAFVKKAKGSHRKLNKTVSNPNNIPLVYDNLDFYSFEECRNIYSGQYVTKDHLCAGYLLSGSGACKYDIGGPGIQNGVLVGVVSFGPERCGKRDKPTVFTKVAPYLKWIHKVLHEVIPKTKPKPNNQTLIKTRKRQQFVSKQHSIYLRNRKLMNIVKNIEKIDNQSEIDDDNESKHFENATLEQLYCLFDKSCELDLDYSDETRPHGRANADRKYEEPKINDDEKTKFVDILNKTFGISKRMRLPMVTKGPVFVHIIPGSAKKDSAELNSEANDELSIPNDQKKQEIHLAKSDISEIAAAVYRKTISEKTRTKEKIHAKRRHIKNRHKDRKRRKKVRKRHRKPKVRVGYTYLN